MEHTYGLVKFIYSFNDIECVGVIFMLRILLHTRHVSFVAKFNIVPGSGEFHHAQVLSMSCLYVHSTTRNLTYLSVGYHHLTDERNFSY